MRIRAVSSLNILSNCGFLSTFHSIRISLLSTIFLLSFCAGIVILFEGRGAFDQLATPDLCFGICSGKNDVCRCDTCAPRFVEVGFEFVSCG